MIVMLSRVSLGAWGLFVIFVLTSLLNSDLRIYWLWLVLGVGACLLIFAALRTGRRLALTALSTASLFLLSFAMYWVAISATIYGSEFSTIERLENVAYLVVGNLQQGQVWLALQIAYIQIAMPLLQAIVLGASSLTYFRGLRVMKE